MAFCFQLSTILPFQLWDFRNGPSRGGRHRCCQRSKCLVIICLRYYLISDCQCPYCTNDGHKRASSVSFISHLDMRPRLKSEFPHYAYTSCSSRLSSKECILCGYPMKSPLELGKFVLMTNELMCLTKILSIETRKGVR
jgi:hypothetical protein